MRQPALVEKRDELLAVDGVIAELTGVASRVGG